MHISIIDKVSELSNHVAHFNFVIFEILCCVKDQYFFGVVSPEPIFVFNVYFLKVFKRNLVFFRSLSCLCSLETLLRSASKIYDFCPLFWCHRFEAAVKWFENLVFTLIHVTIIFHYFWKNIFVSKNAPFRNFQFIWIPVHGLLELFYPSENSINLEGESPSFRIFVVFLKHIDVFSS